MDSNKVKSFRYRLHRFGYKEVVVKKMKSVFDSGVQNYQVFAVEPCSGQRICFLATENQLDEMLRPVPREKGK